MTYYQSSVLDVIESFPEGLPLSRVRNIFPQILFALEHGHCSGYTHHDLKLPNISIDSEDHIYLIDFGFSRHYIPGSRFSGSAGSAHYAAPEIWLRLPYEGPEVDIWAAGVCLFLLVTGHFPFGGTKNHEIWREIKCKEIWKNSRLLHEPELFDLLTKMLEFDSDLRPTLSAIREHPWLNS